MVRRARTALNGLKILVDEGRKVKAVQSRQERRVLSGAFDVWAHEFEARQRSAMKPLEI